MIFRKVALTILAVSLYSISMAQPANDNFAGAIDVSGIINTCSADATYTTVNATSDANGSSCLAGTPNYNVWFKFNAPATGNITLTVDRGGTKGSIRRVVATIYDTDGTTELACNAWVSDGDDVIVSALGLTPAATYFISIDNHSNGAYRGTFTMCLDDALDYDYQAGAILLNDINNFCSADAAYTTIGATDDGSGGSSCLAGTPNYNRWFKFVATSSFINVTVDRGGTKGSIRRVVATIYDTDGTTELACNAWVSDGDDVIVSALGLTPAATYFISVDNHSNGAYRGTFTLCVNDEPDYDFYEGSIELTDLNNWCSANAAYTTIGATGDKNAGSCWANGPTYNRWFNFTAISTNITIQVLRGGAQGSVRRVQLGLWQNDGSTEVDCNRWVSDGDNVSISNGSLIIGNTYYISVDNHNNGAYRGTFTLCVSNIASTFYSIGNGPWNNGTKWSTVSHGGPAAGNYPQVGDVAYIEGDAITLTGNETCAELNINAATSTTNLTINGGSLTLQGQLNMTNPGNNINSTLTVRNGSLSVNDNFTINRNGGTATLDLALDNSTVTINKDLEVYSTAGTNNNTISLVNASTLMITEDALFSNTGGPKTFLTNDASTITFTQNLTLTASADDKIELLLTTAGVLNFKKDVIRGTPAYGILNSAAGTTVYFNSANYLQTFPHSTGSGTGDTFTYQNVVINNTRITSPQLTLDAAVTINESLTLTNGEVLTTASNLLTLVSGATVSGASIASFVDGPIKKIGDTDFEFPVGDNNFWQPIAIANLTGDAATEFTAEYLEQTPIDNLNLKSPDPNGDMNNISGLEYWDLTNTGTASTADVTLHWQDQTRSDIDNGPDLQVAHYTGSEWENLGQNSISFADPGSITVTGITSFSPFSFGSLSNSFNALPVELISFEAYKHPTSIELIWATASEHNNNFFSIEKSPDADQWKEIAKVSGQGNSTERVDYSFSDEYPFKGNQYYRLKQVDFDGTFSYSKIILVNHVGSDKIAFNLYPNPIQHDILYIQSPTLAEINRVIIVDINGKVIEVEAQFLKPGEYQILLENLSGIYIVIISTEEGQFRQKILKL